MNEENLKLIYVLKVGYNSKGEGLYEFLFSTDETKIEIEDWCWDMSPACDNAQPPSEEYINKVISLKTKSFDLFCLHEAVDREYLHGFYTIHALAYEKEKDEEGGFETYENMMEDNEDTPLLVFHYGMTLKQITELLDERKIILKDNNFIETSSLKF